MYTNADAVREALLAAYEYFGADMGFAEEETDYQLGELDSWPTSAADYGDDSREGLELQILCANGEFVPFEKDGEQFERRENDILYLFVTEEEMQYLLHHYDICQSADRRKFWKENESRRFVELEEVQLCSEPCFE